MAQRLLIEPQSGDEDSDCEEDDLLLKDPSQSYYNVNFAPVLKVSYLEVQCGCLGQGQFLLIFTFGHEDWSSFFAQKFT